MKKIAFVTSKEDPLLIRDDQLAIAPLKKLGFSVEPLVWDNDFNDINSFDGLIFRSCWNYHQKYEQFLKWMADLKEYKGRIFNPLDMSLWNLNKKYLLDLSQLGASVPKTEWISKETVLATNDLKTILDRINSDQVVIKPAVSLNGNDTYLESSQEISKIEVLLKKLPKDRDILIQEFIPEIKTAGEISLIFFNNEFSHAIRKTPSANEFRIHSEYGGQRAPVNPNLDLIKQAQDILKMVNKPLLFSRVDVVETAKGAMLIELEIIDPMLFLGYADGAPNRFAEAIANAFE